MAWITTWRWNWVSRLIACFVNGAGSPAGPNEGSPVLALKRGKSRSLITVRRSPFPANRNG
jgi:hypothetical protein